MKTCDQCAHHAELIRGMYCTKVESDGTGHDYLGKKEAMLDTTKATLWVHPTHSCSMFEHWNGCEDDE